MIETKWINTPTIWIESRDREVWDYHNKTNTGKIIFDKETIQEMQYFGFLDFERHYIPVLEKIYFIKDKMKNSIQNIKQKMIVSPKEVKTQLSEKILTEFLLNAEEDTITKIFIVPLLTEMGFEQVRYKGHKEKIMEFGQDINMMKYRLPTGHYLYFVCQIKAGNVGSSFKQPTKNIGGILSEIQLAINKKIFDNDLNKHFTPNHGFLIASGRIGEQAKKFLHETLEESKSSILFLGTDELIELYFKFGIKIAKENQILDYIKENN